MTEEDVRLCLRMGIRHLGFVVEYPESVPWNISREQAKELLRLVDADAPALAGGEKVNTYMVCGGRTEEILRMARYLKPAAIQIHHREEVGEVARIAETLLREGVIKTYRAVSPETPEDELAALCAIPSIEGLVADSRTPETASARGRRLDAEFYARLRARFPRAIFLGGGITPENVREILTTTRADALDVLTGVETIPGRKDETKMWHLMEQICGK